MLHFVPLVSNPCFLWLQNPELKGRLEKGLALMKKIDEQGYVFARKEGEKWQR